MPTSQDPIPGHPPRPTGASHEKTRRKSLRGKVSGKVDGMREAHAHINNDRRRHRPKEAVAWNDSPTPSARSPSFSASRARRPTTSSRRACCQSFHCRAGARRPNGPRAPRQRVRTGGRRSGRGDQRRRARERASARLECTRRGQAEIADLLLVDGRSRDWLAPSTSAYRRVWARGRHSAERRSVAVAIPVVVWSARPSSRCSPHGG